MLMLVILMLFNLNTDYADTDADLCIKMYLCFFQCLLQKTATSIIMVYSITLICHVPLCANYNQHVHV